MALDPGTGGTAGRPRPRNLAQGLVGVVQGVHQQAGAPGAAPPAPATDPYDFSTDPALQRLRAISQRARAEAQAEAQRRRSQLDIDYGLGAAGQGNPFSVLATLARNEKEKPRQLTEGLNSQNLFYSSHFGQEHSNLARALLEERTNAERAYQEGVTGIDSGLRGALLGADERDAEAEESAAGRWRERLGDLPVGGAAATAPRAAAPAAPRLGGQLPGLAAGLVRRTRPASRPRPRPVAGRPVSY